MLVKVTSNQVVSRYKYILLLKILALLDNFLITC